MKQVKAVLCLLLAASMLTGATACGSKTEEASLTSQSAALLSSDNDADDADEDADDEDEDDEDDDAPIDADKLTIRGKSTTAASDSQSAKTTTTTTAAANGASGSAAATTKSGSSASGSKTTTAAKSGSASKTATTAATQAPTEAMTDPAPETDVPAEENVVAGVIDFNTNTFEGEGIALNGATYTITGEGTYILSGNLTGMVEVNTTAKVKLKLNGVSITNPGGPAILVTDAKKLTITLIEGTQNYLTDGYSGVYDGCIFTNDTLEIKGAGLLNVNGTAAHGISSDDDIIVKNGDITVNAVKSGMMANDDITVSGGKLRVTGNTNGIKSKGTLHLSGGTVFAYGGGAEKSALYSGGAFSLTGGYVYAVGCGTAQPDPGLSTQCAIAVRFSADRPAGSWSSINCNGLQFLNETSPYSYNTLFLSTPDVYDGMNFAVFADGIQCGEDMTTAGLATGVMVDLP